MGDAAMWKVMFFHQCNTHSTMYVAAFYTRRAALEAAERFEGRSGRTAIAAGFFYAQVIDDRTESA